MLSFRFGILRLSQAERKRNQPVALADATRCTAASAAAVGFDEIFLNATGFAAGKTGPDPHLQFAFEAVLARHVAHGQNERAVGLFEDLVEIELHGGLLQLKVGGQVTARSLELGAEEAHKADAQLDQIEAPVHHEMPRESSAEGGRADNVAAAAAPNRSRVRFERFERRHGAERRPDHRHGRCLTSAGGIVEADEGL